MKILITTFVLGLMAVYFLVQSPKFNQPVTATKVAVGQFQQDLPVKAKSADAIVRKKTISETLNKTQTTEEFESSFQNLSNKEVKRKLKSMEKMLDNSNLFQQANSEQGLDDESASRLAELIRMRQALNKILLNRKLEEMSRTYL